MIALNQAARRKCYVDTLHLQLVSFELLVACRGVTSLRVTVDWRMPLSIWGDNDSSDGSTIAPGTRRLPILRAAGVKWKLPAGTIVPLLLQAPLLREVESMQVIGVDCSSLKTNGSASRRRDGFLQPATGSGLSPISYFREVQRVISMVVGAGLTTPRREHGVGNIGIATMQNLSEAPWPPALRQLSIGCPCDERVNFNALPKSLERLYIGGSFNQPIEAVSWPVTLVDLGLGGSFNHPIDHVVWPARLAKLSFGFAFDQEIASVEWPISLQRLAFGRYFDQPINDVAWPSSLQQLNFGQNFNQPITEVVWPHSLQKLAFAREFDQPITDVVWPASLEKLSFNGKFNQAIADVVWPAGLHRLQFGDGFYQPIDEVVWPSNLQSLAFGRNFDRCLEGATWPESLSFLACTKIRIQDTDTEAFPSFADPRLFGGLFDEGDGLAFLPGRDTFEYPAETRVEYL